MRRERQGRPQSQKEQMRAGGWFWVLRREGRSMQKMEEAMGHWSKWWPAGEEQHAEMQGRTWPGLCTARRGLAAWGFGASRGEWRGWESGRTTWESGDLRIGLGGG